jgi:hypothetical protein
MLCFVLISYRSLTNGSVDKGKRFISEFLPQDASQVLFEMGNGWYMVRIGSMTYLAIIQRTMGPKYNIQLVPYRSVEAVKTYVDPMEEELKEFRRGGVK